MSTTAPLMGVALLLCSLLLSTHALSVVMQDTSVVELKALYSTLGTFFDGPVNANFTIIRRSDIECDFLPAIPQDTISNHFLVYVDDIGKNDLFRKCTNYYFDSYGNAGFFARFAERRGALGVIVGYAPLNEEYSDYRLSGFTRNIKLPVLVASDHVLDFFDENENSIDFIIIPPIEDKDKDTISSLKSSYHALNIINCILWPILTVLTAYFSFVDFRIFLQMDKSVRTIHPTLSKVAPFISALAASIWHIADPFSFKLLESFPALFLERINFGFIFVTSCLLLKTWILAVGDKLKSPRVFKVSIVAINVLTGLNVLVTILWLGIGFAFRVVPLIFGAVTAISCGVGYVFFGKDIVMILSKQQTPAGGQHKHLSLKIIIFCVIFILFTYTCMIIYLSSAIGAMLSEFLMQFLLALAFIALYSVLFFRKFTQRNVPVTPPPSSMHKSKSPKSSANSVNSANSASSISRTNSVSATMAAV